MYENWIGSLGCRPKICSHQTPNPFPMSLENFRTHLEFLKRVEPGPKDPWVEVTDGGVDITPFFAGQHLALIRFEVPAAVPVQEPPPKQEASAKSSEPSAPNCQARKVGKIEGSGWAYTCKSFSLHCACRPFCQGQNIGTLPV